MKFSRTSVTQAIECFFPLAEVEGIDQSPGGVDAVVAYCRQRAAAGANDELVYVRIKKPTGEVSVETWNINGLSFVGTPTLDTEWFEAAEALTWPDDTRILAASNPTHPIYAEFRKGPDFVDWVAAGYCRFIPLPEKLA